MIRNILSCHSKLILFLSNVPSIFTDAFERHEVNKSDIKLIFIPSFLRVQVGDAGSDILVPVKGVCTEASN